MYLIVGASGIRHLFLATIPSANDALDFYRAKVGSYITTYVVSPDGVQLDEDELAVHATAEIEAMAMIDEARTLH